MRAGIRRVRQDLSALLREVKEGREIEITDRGEPVARLSPPRAKAARRFEGRAALRASMPMLDPPLSAAVLHDREDRF
jgi:prevent-host-death family protein